MIKNIGNKWRTKGIDMNGENVIYDIEYTLEDDMAKKGITKWFSKSHKIFSIVTPVLGIMGMIQGIIDTVLRSYQTGAFFFTTGLLLIWMRFMTPYMNAKREIKSLHSLFETDENCGRFRFKFYDNGFSMITKLATNKYMYGDIVKLIDIPQMFIINVRGRKLLFVVKEAIDNEQLEEFTKFIVDKKEKAGNEVITPKDTRRISEIIADSEAKSKEIE